MHNISRRCWKIGNINLRIIAALDDVPSVCLTNYLCSYVKQLYVLFIVLRRNWIYIFTQGMIFHASRDLTTTWTMETV